jgi:hypothetical protein
LGAFYVAREDEAMHVYEAVKFFHIITVVFFYYPHKKQKVFNKRLCAVDRYFENLIKTNAIRCFVFQATAFVTGILLLPLSDQPLSTLFTNPVLLAKFSLLLVLTVLLSYVHLGIQPRIEALLVQVQGNEIPPEVVQQILPWRVRRKKMAGFCLFFVITLVLLGLQVFSRFDPLLTGLLVLLAALFSWRVYKSPIPYGWI